MPNQTQKKHKSQISKHKAPLSRFPKSAEVLSLFFFTLDGLLSSAVGRGQSFLLKRFFLYLQNGYLNAKLQYKKLRHMNLLENMSLLQNAFASISLQNRQSGLIDMVSMRWSDPSQTPTVREFKDIYLSRIKKFESKFSANQFVKIATVSKQESKASKQIIIRGVLKRLELLRVRAFQKNFAQRYDGEHPIYNQLDEMEIQDETGKIKIVLTEQTSLENTKLKLTDLPSGVVVALSGKFKLHSNQFIVKKVLLPELAPQPAMALNYINNEGLNFYNKKILIVSQPNNQTLNRVKQTIFNSCSESLNIISLIIIGGFELKVQQIQMIGEFIEEMKNFIDVFLMPSSSESRKRLFPLQPYNGLYFIKSQTEIGLCSNPQLFQAENGLKIHVSCGQNVKDFLNNCSMANNQAEVLENMVKFSHFCPTSPFSLKTQPFAQDYFVMQEMPHVMVAGKSKKFNTKLTTFNGHKRVLLVSIPQRGMGLVSLNGEWSKQLL